MFVCDRKPLQEATVWSAGLWVAIASLLLGGFSGRPSSRVWSDEISGDELAGGIAVQRAIPFAEVDGHTLRLDLYRPTKVDRPPPVVVWVHGGAWRRGSREQMPLRGLVARGIAVASVDYRLSPVAKFPAQVHDIKAAIRFLRANAKQLEVDSQRLAIAGASAGGHLAAVVGVSHGNASLEGNVGEHDQQSSAVDAIVDYYGPTNFQTILQQSTPHGLSVRVPALQLLIGGRPEEFPELAKVGSAVEHVDPEDPPLLMIHGDQDPQVPINQSHELHGRYKSAGLSAHLEVLHGGAHGGAEFYDAQRTALVYDFLTKHWNEK